MAALGYESGLGAGGFLSRQGPRCRSRRFHSLVGFLQAGFVQGTPVPRLGVGAGGSCSGGGCAGGTVRPVP